MATLKKNRKKITGTRGRHRKSLEEYSFSEADDRVYDIFRNHDFADVPHEIRHQLVKFYLILREEQKRQNITRLLTLRDTAIKHFLDCLLVPKLTKLCFPLLDMGTGAGFPGIPLKILYPTERIILGEGVQKRVAFLKQLREKMEFQNLDIVGRNITRDFHLPVQGVITRAVMDISETLSLVVNCVQLDGKIFLMKGPSVDEEIKRAKKEWGKYFELIEDHHYEIPKTPHKRRLVVYKKIKESDFLSEDNE
jgi:16S rRNA (guanine527-N7)-methyltransferase